MLNPSSHLSSMDNNAYIVTSQFPGRRTLTNLRMCDVLWTRALDDPPTLDC